MNTELTKFLDAHGVDYTIEDGDLEFGDFDVELVEYTEDGDVTGVKIQEEITIENFLSDYEEHSIMYGNILGVCCGKSF